MYLSLKSSLDTKSTSSITPPPAPEPASTKLLFYGATSVLGGTDYQMGQLWHNVTIGANSVSTVLVTKTNQSTDVDISTFNNTGTVSAEGPTTFQIRAIGSRNATPSTLTGANTNDSIGVNGFNPNKIDIIDGNDTEQIKWEVRDLDPAFTLSIKTIYCTRANFVGTSKPQCVVTPFDPLGLQGSYTINSSGTNIVPINVSSSEMNLVGTGSGVNGDFTIGIGATEGSNVGYGLYAIDFDITDTP